MRDRPVSISIIYKPEVESVISDICVGVAMLTTFLLGITLTLILGLLMMFFVFPFLLFDILGGMLCFVCHKNW